MGFPRQEYWSGLPFLLQRIFPTQGLDPGLLHCRQILYHLSHQWSPPPFLHFQWQSLCPEFLLLYKLAFLAIWVRPVSLPSTVSLPCLAGALEYRGGARTRAFTLKALPVTFEKSLVTPLWHKPEEEIVQGQTGCPLAQRSLKPMISSFSFPVCAEDPVVRACLVSPVPSSQRILPSWGCPKSDNALQGPGRGLIWQSQSWTTLIFLGHRRSLISLPHNYPPTICKAPTSHPRLMSLLPLSLCSIQSSLGTNLAPYSSCMLPRCFWGKILR